MKRIISLVLALAVCTVLVCSVSATNGGFAPSITYKPGPEIVPIPNPGDLPATDRPIIGIVYNDDSHARISLILDSCIVITPISMVDTSKEIPPQAAEELRWIYKELVGGNMKIPYEKFGNFIGKKLVLTDLLDASWTCGYGDTDRGFSDGGSPRVAFSGVAACSDHGHSAADSTGIVFLGMDPNSAQEHSAADSYGVIDLGSISASGLRGLIGDGAKVAALSEIPGLDHDHPTEVRPKGVVFDLTFKTNVAPDAEVVVMVWSNGEWEPAVRALNNGDGTVTCTFEKLGIISVSVVVDENDTGDSEDDSPETGDDTNVWLWAVVMAGALAALVLVVILYRREGSGRKRK